MVRFAYIVHLSRNVCPSDFLISLTILTEFRNKNHKYILRGRCETLDKGGRQNLAPNLSEIEQLLLTHKSIAHKELQMDFNDVIDRKREETTARWTAIGTLSLP